MQWDARRGVQDKRKEQSVAVMYYNDIDQRRIKTMFYGEPPINCQDKKIENRRRIFSNLMFDRKSCFLRLLRFESFSPKPRK
jgi:hypothetical protein